MLTGLLFFTSLERLFRWEKMTQSRAGYRSNFCLVPQGHRRWLRHCYFRRTLLAATLIWSRMVFATTSISPTTTLALPAPPATVSPLVVTPKQARSAGKTATVVPPEKAQVSQWKEKGESQLSRSQWAPESTKTPAAKKNLSAYAKFESILYPTVLPGQEALGQSHMMEAGATGAYNLYPIQDTGAFNLDFQMAAGRSLNLNYSYVSVDQFALGWKMNRPSLAAAVQLGRRLQHWNEADETWNLGLWQPTYATDSIRVHQQGLMGAHVALASNFVQVEAYGSPMFIPSISPDLADRDGEITSQSRWFRSIPTSLEFNGRPLQLYYRLSIPEIRRLVGQASAGAQVRLGRVDRGPWLRVAAGDKPMNSLFFKYDANVRARESGAKSEVELVPVVHRHKILSADLGWQFENRTDSKGDEIKTAVTLSMMQEQVVLGANENVTLVEGGAASDYYQQTPRPAKAASLVWDQPLRFPWLGPVQGQFSYLKVDVEPTRDLDSQGQVMTSLLPHRFNFTNAVSLVGRARLSDRWATRLKYLRDFDQQGSLWSFAFEYQSLDHWVVTVGGDTLGPDDKSQGNVDTRFLNYYRQNDRVYGGLSYVF